MKKIMKLVSAACFALLLAGRAFAALEIMSVTPQGLVAEGSVPGVITVMFSEPMTALAGASENAGCPFSVTPAIKGACSWTDTRTAVFTPERPFDYARQYKIFIPAGLKSVTGQTLQSSASAEFTTPLVRVLNAAPMYEERWVSVFPTVFFRFNQPVNYAQVRSFVSIKDAAGNVIQCGVRKAKPEEVEKLFPYYMTGEGEIPPSTATVLAVKPVRQLKYGTEYTVVLAAGLPGQGGAGTTAGQSIRFWTQGDFKFNGVSSSQKCMPQRFVVSLSNPVSYESFVNHLVLPKGLKAGALSDYEKKGFGGRSVDSYVYNLDWLDFEPGQVYKLTLKKGLADVFGNKLAADVNFSVAPGDYCEKLTFTGGFGILENEFAPKHVYSVLNSTTVSYRQKAVAAGNFIPEYSKLQGSRDEEYGAYHGEDGEKSDESGTEPSDDAAPAAARQDDNMPQMTLFPPLTKNKRYYGGIDLSTATPFVLTKVYLPSSERWAWAFDNVTGIGITMKASTKGGLVWTTALGKGEPLGRVNITLRGTDNKVLWSGRTDGDGVAEIPAWPEIGVPYTNEYSAPELWAFAEKNGDTAVLALSFAAGLEPWRFGLSTRFEAPQGEARTLLFTDRGLYRPGETVSVKGFLRRHGKKGLGYSGVKEVFASISDSKGVTVSSFTVPVSAYSSFDFTFPVSKTAGTGWWNISVENTSGSGEKAGESVSFQVEAFKRAQFAVSVTPLTKNYYPGEEFSASVDGWYLGGAPMAGAGVEWSMLLSPAPFRPEGTGLDQYIFTNADYTADRVIAAGKGTLDSNGRMLFSVPAVTGTITRPYTLLAEAAVLSPDMQRLFSRSGATLHPADFYVGVNGPWRVEKSTVQASAKIIAVRPEGRNLPGIAVQGLLTRREYRNVARAGFSGRLEIVSEEKVVNAASFTFVTGDAPYEWFIPQDLAPGSYRLDLTGTGENGQKNSTAFTFYVPGTGDGDWQRDDTDIIALTPDKNEYRPGDTAKIMIKSPFEKTWALVTVEREGIIESRVERITGGAHEIKLKLNEKHVPNVYVGVVLVDGRTAKPTASSVDAGKPKAKFGYINLTVSPAENILKVELKPSAREYKPGEQAVVDVRTLDAEGSGVSAEVAFYAVDEGVLNMAGYTTPDLFSKVYSPVQLGVKTVDSRPFVIGQRSFGEKGENRGGGGGAGAAGIDIRSNFIPLAVWQPSLVTDKKGAARVSFKLPDTLTSYRIIAVAGSETRFGSSTETFKVSKPLMLKAALPRFARKNDAFKAGTVLINYSTNTITASVGMSVSGALSADSAAKEVTLKSGEARRLEWDYKAVSTGTAEIIFTARAGDETDGLKQTVEVGGGELPESTAVSMSILKSNMQLLKRPANAVSAELAVTLSPTIMSSLKSPAEYLVMYRYECLEQKLSKLAPLFAGTDFSTRFIPDSVDKLKKQAVKLFSELGAFRGPGGGFGYWEDSYYSDPWLTAYALESYAQAAKAGYKVEPQVIADAVKYLQGWLKRENSNSDISAYALYALALNGSYWPDAFTRLYDIRDQLSGEGAAYLLRAGLKLNSKAQQRTELSRILLNRLRLNGETAYFDETAFSPFSHGSAVKTTALCMQALIEADGGYPAAENTAKWLVRAQKNGQWYNTTENAAALRALEYYFSAYEKPDQVFTARVTAPTGELLTARFENLKPVISSVTADALELTKASATIPVKFEKDGEGRLYYTMRLNTVPASYKTPLARGFTVKRTIKVYGGAPFTPGVRAEVTVTLDTPQDRYFVALEDFVPAGAEIVNTNLAAENSANAADSAAGEEYDEQSYYSDYRAGFNFVQRYDDRIAAFADYLPAGHHEFKYVIQGVASGEYTVPAGMVSCMYEPDVFGRTATDKVKILPAVK